MRVHLIVPPDLTKLENAPATDVDAMWLEGDPQVSVPALRNVAGLDNRPQCYVRLADPGRVDDALDILMPDKPDGLILPIERGADVQRLAVKLAVREAELGFEDGATQIIAMIASPGAICRLSSLQASPRLSALAFDSRAFAEAIGCDDDAGPVALARHTVVLVARAIGVLALLVETRRNEVDVLSDMARRDGFDGIVTQVRAGTESAPGD